MRGCPAFAPRAMRRLLCTLKSQRVSHLRGLQPTWSTVRAAQPTIAEGIHSEAGPSERTEPGGENDDAPSTPSVDPLPTCAWHADHVNKVRITGTVGSPPEVRQIGEQQVAQINLGIRARMQDSPELSWITVDCWDHEARQVAQHVHKGMQIAVGGHLKQAKWTDRTTGQRREAIRVVAEYVMAVDPSRGVPEGTPVAAGAAAGGGRPLRQRVPREPGARRSLPPQQSMELFLLGHSIPDIAAHLGKLPRTVTKNLLDSITAGPAEAPTLAKLASCFQLGPPDSPWMTGDEINEAIEAAVASSTDAAGNPATLDTVYLRHIREALQRHPEAGLKLASQEQLASEKEGLTYNQIRLVLTMKQQGVDWNSVVVQNPLQTAAAELQDEDAIPF